jgi:hypothetical protein
MKKKKKIGFAAMSKKRVIELARMGGKAAYAKKLALLKEAEKKKAKKAPKKIVKKVVKKSIKKTVSRPRYTATA